MPLTPADIHHAEFGKASLGRRGYDEEQVDALLDAVSQEMTELLDEKELLQRQAGRADEFAGRAQPGDTRPTDAQLAELAALRAELDRARHECEQAEQNARQLQRRLGEARRAAAAPAAPAEAASNDNPGVVMAMAQQTADDHMHEARRQSHAMAAEAREQSDRVTREAMDKVRDIEQETRRRQQAAAAELEAGDAAVRREIERLTSFAESYRTALAQHLRAQSQHADSTT
ncbi:DivIVA domain-containing protein [Actinoplanes sp. NPDC051633]|uniref:DivIVA domain-containing protein n=1 Tax=Actinoplanes sp. NPDC051633 TaxID=3155670 RepID=UPI00341EB799